jgi:hypothetical protein
MNDPSENDKKLDACFLAVLNRQDHVLDGVEKKVLYVFNDSLDQCCGTGEARRSIFSIVLPKPHQKANFFLSIYAGAE